MIYVCAGMYRSGSTWLYNAVRLVLRQAGTPDLAAGAIGERERLLAHAHAVIKVHAFDADLASRESIVLTSHRDLRDIAASLVRKFADEDPLASLRDTVGHHAQWARSAALDLRYEDLLRDKRGALERIAAALRLPADALRALDYDAIAREIENEAFDERRATAQGHDAVNLLHAGHVTDGRHGSWSETLPAEAVREIEREFRPWLAARGYLSPRDHAISPWRWLGRWRERRVQWARFRALAGEVSSIYAEWDKAFAPAADAYVHPLWRAAQPAFADLLRAGLPRDFLRNRAVAEMFCRQGFESPQRHELAYLDSRAPALRSLAAQLCESPIGRPRLDCRERALSANSLGMLYYFTRIAERIAPGDLSTIVEFGGGYGCLCRVFLELLPRTPTYVIIDLPEMLALQYVFVQASSRHRAVPHFVAPVEIVPGAVNLVPVSLAADLQIEPEPDLFVSTFALSETPRRLQEQIADDGFFDSAALYLVGQEVEDELWRDSAFDSSPLREAVRRNFADVQIEPYHFASAWELFARRQSH